jgi:hypothetical protein
MSCSSPPSIVLGHVLDLFRMTVGTPQELIVATVTLFRMTCGSHGCTFKVKEAKELTDKLNHIAFSIP